MLKRYRHAAVVMVFVWGGLIIGAEIAAITAPAVRDLIEDESGGPKGVALIMHATDKNGNPVLPSSLQAVEVTEQGEKLQILSGPTMARPEQIAFVVDSNFHQKHVLQLEKETLEGLLSHFEKERAHVLVMNYGTGIRTSGALTDDSDSLRAFIRSIQVDTDKRNDTILLFDALKEAIDAVREASGNKAIVLFAEGNGYGNSIRPQTLASLAQKDHIACYVVLFADHSFYGTKAIRRYGWDLADLAPKTGGKFWEAGNDARKTEKIVAEIVRETSSQAIIEVVPSVSRAHAFHRIRVTSSRRRLQAQTGYYDGSH